MRTKKHTILLLFSIIAITVSSFTMRFSVIPPVISQPVFDGAIPMGNFEKLEIPLKRVNNLFLIEARIDSLEGNFIFDTGAPKLVLNKTYFRNWKLSGGSTAYGIAGTNTQIFRQVIDSLIIDSLYFTDLDADVVNLGHIETAKGVKILGLLGANLFTDMEMVIDERNSKLILYKLDKAGERIFKGDIDTLIPDIDIPIELYNDIIYLNGESAGKKLRFCFDTGAEINVLDNTVNNKVLSHFSLTNRAVLGGSSDQNVGVLRGELDYLIVDEDSLKNMAFVLTGLSSLETAYNTTLDGILGFPFLEKGLVIIYTKKKKLYQYFYKEETR